MTRPHTHSHRQTFYNNRDFFAVGNTLEKMVHSLLKRILTLEKKTMKILHSSSSSSSIEDGESQIVKVTSVKFTLPDDLPAKTHNHNFSKNGTTSTLPSSYITTRSNCHLQDRKWITCVILTVLLLVLLLTTLLTFYNPSSQNDLNYSGSGGDGDDARGQVYSVQLSDHNMTSANLSSSTSSDNKIIPSLYDPPYTYKKEKEGDGVKDNYSRTNSNNNNHGGGSKSKSKQNNFDLKTVSRLSWEILNRKSSTSKPNTHHSKNSSSDRRVIISSDKELDSFGAQGGIEKLGQGEIILPSVMVFTSRGSSTNGEINNLRNVRQESGGKSNNNNSNNNKSCCRTQKYTQTVKVDGCQPMTVVNRMCFGQCVSVWVPSLFASFPVCKPSRSTWKAVTLTCGPQRDKKKRVKIEKVRRCSCMELK